MSERFFPTVESLDAIMQRKPYPQVGSGELAELVELAKAALRSNLGES